MILKVKIKTLGIVFLLSADQFFNVIIKNERSLIIMAKSDRKWFKKRRLNPRSLDLTEKQ